MAIETHNGARLTWNANTESDLASYTVLFGQRSGVYTSTVNTVVPVTSQTLAYTAFNNDGTWYFAVAAVDTSNNVSLNSNIVSKRIIRTEGQLVMRR